MCAFEKSSIGRRYEWDLVLVFLSFDAMIFAFLFLCLSDLKTRQQDVFDRSRLNVQQCLDLYQTKTLHDGVYGKNEEGETLFSSINGCLYFFGVLLSLVLFCLVYLYGRYEKTSLDRGQDRNLLN
jgi:hypothetical protein